MRRAGTKADAGKVEKAAELFGVALDTLDHDRLSAAYRAAIRDNHPDVAKASGRDRVYTVDQIKDAKEVLERFLGNVRPKSRPHQCPVCLGGKTVQLPGSFRVTKCPRCGGKGEINGDISRR